MSSVTNLMLYVSLPSTGDEVWIAELTEYMGLEYNAALVSIDDESLPLGWSGGAKGMDPAVAARGAAILGGETPVKVPVKACAANG